MIWWMWWFVRMNFDFSDGGTSFWLLGRRIAVVMIV